MLTPVGQRSTVKRADNKAHARAVTEPRRRPGRAVREYGMTDHERNWALTADRTYSCVQREKSQYSLTEETGSCEMPRMTNVAIRKQEAVALDN